MEYPVTPRGVWLFFSSGDLSPLTKHSGRRVFVKRRVDDYPLAGIGNDPPMPYLTIGNETRGDIQYKVVTVSFYYNDNPATGPGWQLQPTNRNLGYHPDDMEFISIYYLDDEPTKVYFSAHSVGQGNGTWMDFSNCQSKADYLVVYVARNSHANYPNAGTHYRIYGAANDVTESNGPNRAYSWQEMTPSYDWSNGHGITLYKGLRPPPPDFSKSNKQRILYGL